jgi:hypothetical protein
VAAWDEQSGPRQDLGQEPNDDGVLVFGVAFGVGTVVAVVRLVPQVPCKDAGIVGERAKQPFHIDLEARKLRGIVEDSRSRACTHPELCTPGMGGCCGPSFGLGSQHESKRTKTGRM